MSQPIYTFIENMKLINKEKETKELDEHAKFMLAMEAMKSELLTSQIHNNFDGIVTVLKWLSENVHESSEKLSSAIDDQHIVGEIDVNLAKALINPVDAEEPLSDGMNVYQPLLGRDVSYRANTGDGNTDKSYGTLVGINEYTALIQDWEGNLVKRSISNIKIEVDTD